MSYKWWIIVAITLFSFGIGIGIALGLATPTSIVELLVEELTIFEKQLGDLLASPKLIIAMFIFIKNTSVLVLSFVLSPILCLFPILALTVNGVLVGFLSPLVVSERSLGFLLAGLLPHGAFEIPALLLGEAAALSFGTMVIIALFKKERRKLLLPNLKQNLIYLAIALALLVPAAIIETYVTPLLLGQ